MTFRVKISVLLISAVFLSIALVSAVNAHLVSKDRVTQIGDVQGAMAKLVQLRLRDHLELLGQQFSQILKNESKPLQALEGSLEGYLGGEVWVGNRRIEASPSALPSEPPQWQGLFQILPGSPIFAKGNFGFGIQVQDRKMVLYLDTTWLESFSPSQYGVMFGLLIYENPLWTKTESNYLSPKMIFPKSQIPTTQWLEDELGEKYLVTTYPVFGGSSSQIILATPSQKIYAVLQQAFYRVLGIALVLSLIAVVISQLLSWGITQPLLELQEATRSIGKGLFKIQFPKILKRKDEFGELGKAFVSMGSELEQLKKELIHAERLSALGKFSASIVHEIKNPLTGVLLTSEMAQMQLQELKGKAETSEIETCLKHMVEDIQRANRKITSLMKFSRKDSVIMDMVNLKAQLESSMKSIVPTLKLQGVSVELEYSEEEVFINGNAENLHEVFLNLCQNAAYAMKNSAKKELRIKISKKIDTAVIEIQDTGMGMTEETQARLFEPFFTTKPIGEGTGLGLSACQGIVKTHSGSILVESKLNVGTRFVLSFPLISDPTQSLVNAKNFQLLILPLLFLLSLGCQKKGALNQFPTNEALKQVERPIAVLEKRVPKVSVRRRQQMVWGDGNLKMDLFIFDTVKTFTQSSSQIVMNEGSEINLSADSWIVLDPNNLEILPHRPFLKLGKLKAKTRKEIWILTTAALFRLKAKSEREPAEMEVSVDNSRKVTANLVAGMGLYWGAKVAGQIEGKDPKRLFLNQLVTLNAAPVDEEFPKTEKDIRWPTAEDVLNSDKLWLESKKNKNKEKEKALELEIISPPDFYQVSAPTVEIVGKVTHSDAVVLVNGKRVSVDKTLRFSAQVDLKPGANQVVVRINHENQSKTVSLTLIRKPGS